MTESLEPADLAYELSVARDEARRFKWHGERGLLVLDKCRKYLTALRDGAAVPCDIDKLILAIDVVSGHAADWDHELHDWLPT